MPKMILSRNCFQTFRSKGRMSYQISEIFIFHELIDALSLQEEFAGVVARVESLRGRMGESERQVEGLFESLLSESFGGT